MAALPREEAPDVILVAEEALELSKRQIVTGKVRVSTRTETYDHIAEIALDRAVVDVTRVPIDRVVEVAPAVRTEGDTVIVPVLEERSVVVKQLVLKEELHIRRRVEHKVSHIPVALRRQVATVDHIDREGRIIPDDRLVQADHNHAEDGVHRGETHGHS
ncbi:YsnF/AvaK domain-containing protein [Lichenihabitans sp. Uapishka_5]|uniref:YsnF/AvaK domain-containing protein n=1 Tax=Lichenihabitans sp. Uapishka_5 TaxID=3037302 RepID=UPI0029E7F2BF|nr:YsnF/AvaK domain-containing protein [Lichenihabitans sp. Uapishka_5]MDX7951229.1 YsnF/AvaK domain-containing protein [Lichenihabitans sp. Uapishka_5]